jgi:hypothetical protein
MYAVGHRFLPRIDLILREKIQIALQVYIEIFCQKEYAVFSTKAFSISNLSLLVKHNDSKALPITI